MIPLPIARIQPTRSIIQPAYHESSAEYRVYENAIAMTSRAPVYR